MTTAKRTKWADGGTQCNLCTKEAVWSGLCGDCTMARREMKPCAECGLEATHSVTCPYLARLQEIYSAARAWAYAGTPMGKDSNEWRLKRAIEAQIKVEMAKDQTQESRGGSGTNDSSTEGRRETGHGPLHNSSGRS